MRTSGEEEEEEEEGDLFFRKSRSVWGELHEGKVGKVLKWEGLVRVCNVSKGREE